MKLSTHNTINGFVERTASFMNLAGTCAERWYDGHGNWLAPTTPHGTRERFWLCFALYVTGRSEFADSIIRPAPLGRSGDVYFDIFETNIACALLIQHRDRMAHDVVEKLELLVRHGFSLQANRRPDYQFHGYNDNMPAKATMGLILGGEMLGDEDAIQHGVWNLRRFADQLSRNGTNAEYNSPTYSPLTIHALGEIASNTRTPEAKDLSLEIEEKLWMDIARRFHLEMGVTAGPYSRAYTCDTVAHVSLLSSLLWFVLGDVSRPSPMLLFDEAAPLILHHSGDRPFNVSQMCWLASGHYNLPQQALDSFQDESYPRIVLSVSEQGDANPDYPTRRAFLSTYLEKDFTLGTASSPFMTGEQAMTYFVTYKRKKEVESFVDVGTVFSKLVVNDDVPGFIPESQFENSGEQDNLDSRGNYHVIQSTRTALVTCHPHLALGGFSEGGPRDREATPISQLREMVIFPSHFGGADAIWANGEYRSEWTGGIALGEWFACQRGRLFIAIYPLAYGLDIGKAALSLTKHGAYEVLESTFYKGAARMFSRYELRHIFGGFIAEHASVNEFDTLEDFVRSLQSASIVDYYWNMRTLSYDRPDSTYGPALTIQTAFTVGAHQPRFVTINGTAWENYYNIEHGEHPRPFNNLPYPSLKIPHYDNYGFISEYGA